jgi:hypothetical protein
MLKHSKGARKVGREAFNFFSSLLKKLVVGYWSLARIAANSQ